MTQPLPSPNYRLQDQIYRLVQDRPDVERNLREMVEWEDAHPQTAPYPTGWEWAHVHTSPGLIAALVSQGLIDQMDSSRQHTIYRLHSLEDTRAALEQEDLGSQQEPMNVDDLFDLVVGHTRVKGLLKYAVVAAKPIHMLLRGAPGVAKTIMLQDIGKLPGAHFYVGSTTTKAGLVGLLLQEQPRILVIDEIDKVPPADMSPLLNLMENGLVTRLQHGRRDRLEMNTKVFAGANDLKRLQQQSPALLSRFAIIEIPAYTTEQFQQVARQVLMKREGQGPEVAKMIAMEVAASSNDIRDAVRVARMAQGSPRQVMEIVGFLWPGNRKPTPIREV